MSAMKLQHLFAVFQQIPENSFLEKEVSGIFSDARLCIPSSVFVAIRGSVADGHKYIVDAIKAGAIALVVVDGAQVPSDYIGLVLVLPQTREALDILASRFYSYPGQDLFCVGVTGTNGKTSITYMIENILNRSEMPTGVIGTIDHHLQNKVWSSNMTTPDPVSVQMRLCEFLDAGAKAVAMEVSSHALDQFRVDGVPFNTVIFTNLTRDHLDYHKDMDSYFQAKQRLFTDLMWKTTKRPVFAIVNVDDKYGRRLKIADPVLVWTYGAKDADFKYKVIKMDFTSTQFHLQTPVGDIEVHLPMSGLHNVANATASIAAGVSAGIPLQVCASAMSLFLGVPGRLQAVPHRQNFSVFVDYAHTPDALENVLSSLVDIRSNLKSSAKIWTIFGCGGDRDKGKRPLMAQASLQFSDHVMITSDNPRTEDPLAIVNEIYAGIPGEAKSKVMVQVDRRKALQEVFAKVQEGDVVLIAGKGHEDYQIVGTAKLPFSDYMISQEILGSL